MIVSKKLNDLFKEISTKTTEYGNSENNKQKYIRKIVSVFMNTLTEDERVFITWYIFENLHYRSLLIDPETMLSVNNIQLKTILFVAAITIIITIIFSIAFDKNSVFGKIYRQIADMVVMLLT